MDLLDFLNCRLDVPTVGYAWKPGDAKHIYVN
jgi:hypothetical protein